MRASESTVDSAFRFGMKRRKRPGVLPSVCKMLISGGFRNLGFRKFASLLHAETYRGHSRSLNVSLLARLQNGWADLLNESNASHYYVILKVYGGMRFDLGTSRSTFELGVSEVAQLQRERRTEGLIIGVRLRSFGPPAGASG